MQCTSSWTLAAPNNLPHVHSTQYELLSSSTKQKQNLSFSLFLSLMATTLTFIGPTIIRASGSSPGKPDRSSRKPVSSNWWSPLLGWAADPDYMGSWGPSQKAVEESELGRPRWKFAPGCFTAEKAKELRIKTVETSTFHDIMYHSAIASRLASDVSKGYDK